jgi:3' terminal RNA ribose 2'-O-methyltransferase Hen1
MLLLVTSQTAPAVELGYLLHKHPDKAHAFDLSFGTAHVFYPEVGEQRCTAALLLEVDPVRLVRGGESAEGGGLVAQYVNDRPYAASSFLSVAIAQTLRSALAGTCKQRPELPERPLELHAQLPAVPCRGGEGLLRRLFEPLGYAVDATRLPLDPEHPEWGEGPYYAVSLRRTCTLRELLGHLYVLIPVLDDAKHYFIGDAEVDKLLRHGEGWLPGHPERELIARRYLKHRGGLLRQALGRLSEGEGEAGDPDAAAEARDAAEEAIERTIGLNDVRLEVVAEALAATGAESVLDLGCGYGKLLARLLKRRQFSKIVGVDVSHVALERAEERLGLAELPERTRARLQLLHGSLVYRDSRLAGFDAAAAVEVIEHLELDRLPSFERALFECARPGTVIVTTPNAEYNVKFKNMAPGTFRHGDHRFEWTRAEFRGWAEAVALRRGYTVEFADIGEVDPELGAPTQMGVFRRCP